MKLSLLLFVLVTFALALWLFASWFNWDMADFNCEDGYWDCRQDLIVPTALQAGLPLLAWGTWAIILFRSWKKL